MGKFVLFSNPGRAEPPPHPTPEDDDARVNGLKNQFIDAKQHVLYTAPQAFLRTQGSGAITEAEGAGQVLADLRRQTLDRTANSDQRTRLGEMPDWHLADAEEQIRRHVAQQADAWQQSVAARTVELATKQAALESGDAGKVGFAAPASMAWTVRSCGCYRSSLRALIPMTRLFIALPVPDEAADALTALQNGVPDAHWVPPENFHVTLAFCGEVQGGVMRDLEEELSDIAGGPFAVSIAGVDQFSSGKQPRALVALVERSDRLDWLQQKVTTVARNCGIAVDRRKFRPHVTLARFGSKAETGHHIAQFMASHGTFRLEPWIADGFALYSSRGAGGGRAYIEEAGYALTF